jgi:hypothetical protein
MMMVMMMKDELLKLQTGHLYNYAQAVLIKFRFERAFFPKTR